MSASGSKGGYSVVGGGAGLVSVVGAMGTASLTNASGVSTGTPLAGDGNRARANHTLQVNASAGVTAGTIRLQGSLDGVNWFNMDTSGISVTAAGCTAENVSNYPAAFIRAAITVAITGGTVTAYVAMV